MISQYPCLTEMWAFDKSVRLLKVHTKAALLVNVLILKLHQLNPQLGEDFAAVISEFCHLLDAVI